MLQMQNQSYKILYITSGNVITDMLMWICTYNYYAYICSTFEKVMSRNILCSVVQLTCTWKKLFKSSSRDQFSRLGT